MVVGLEYHNSSIWIDKQC